MKTRTKYLLLLFLCLLALIHQAFLRMPEPVINTSENQLQNVTPRLLQKLKSLYRSADTNRMEWLHIGDSHADIGVFPAAIRSEFEQMGITQATGWFFPEGHAELHIRGHYSETNLYSATRFDDLGLTGRTWEFHRGKAEIHWRGTSELRVLHHPMIRIAGTKVIQHPWNQQITESRLSQQGLRKGAKLQADGQNLQLYGFRIEHPEARLIYSDLAISGSQYAEYNAAALGSAQMQALHPDVVLITLGTNDAYRMDEPESDFKARVQLFVHQWKQMSPQTDIILMTAPYTRWEGHEAEWLDRVNEAILAVAREEQVAVWDWYRVSGGKAGFESWVAAGLVDRDGLHFSKSGYELIGKLFVKALQKAAAAD